MALITFLVNEETHHIIVKMDRDEYKTAIKKIRKNTYMDKKSAQEYFRRKLITIAQNLHDARGNVDFELTH